MAPDCAHRSPTQVYKLFWSYNVKIVSFSYVWCLRLSDCISCYILVTFLLHPVLRTPVCWGSAWLLSSDQNHCQWGDQMTIVSPHLIDAKDTNSNNGTTETRVAECPFCLWQFLVIVKVFPTDLRATGSSLVFLCGSISMALLAKLFSQFLNW